VRVEVVREVVVAGDFTNMSSIGLAVASPAPRLPSPSKLSNVVKAEK
jgi:hypothetical protein